MLVSDVCVTSDHPHSGQFTEIGTALTLRRNAVGRAEGFCMPLEIVEEREGAVPVLRLLGPLDVSNVDQLRRRIATLVDLEPPAIALDMVGVSLVDTSAMGVLLSGKRRTRERHMGYYLLDCPASVVRLLKLAGIDRLLEFCTRQELREWFPARGVPPSP
jgi:anti-anti-sigma factor